MFLVESLSCNAIFISPKNGQSNKTNLFQPQNVDTDINMYICIYVYHSVLLRISPTLKYWPHPFLPTSPLKKKNSKSVRLPLYEQPPLKFWRTWLTPWNVFSSKKAKTHFLKKQMILFPAMKWEHIWMLKYKYTVAKSKNQRRLRRLLSILFLLGS